MGDVIELDSLEKPDLGPYLDPNKTPSSLNKRIHENTFYRFVARVKKVKRNLVKTALTSEKLWEGAEAQRRLVKEKPPSEFKTPRPSAAKAANPPHLKAPKPLPAPPSNPPLKLNLGSASTSHTPPPTPPTASSSNASDEEAREAPPTPKSHSKLLLPRIEEKPRPSKVDSNPPPARALEKASSPTTSAKELPPKAPDEASANPVAVAEPKVEEPSSSPPHRYSLRDRSKLPKLEAQKIPASVFNARVKPKTAQGKKPSGKLNMSLAGKLNMSLAVDEATPRMKNKKIVLVDGKEIASATPKLKAHLERELSKQGKRSGGGQLIMMDYDEYVNLSQAPPPADKTPTPRSRKRCSGESVSCEGCGSGFGASRAALTKHLGVCVPAAQCDLCPAQLSSKRLVPHLRRKHHFPFPLPSK